MRRGLAAVQKEPCPVARIVHRRICVCFPVSLPALGWVLGCACLDVAILEEGGAGGPQSKRCSWAWCRVTGWGQRRPDGGRLSGHRGQATWGALAAPSQDTVLWPLQLADLLCLHFSLHFALSAPHLSFFIFLPFLLLSPVSFPLSSLNPNSAQVSHVSRGTQPRGNSANFCSHLHSLLAYTFYILDAIIIVALYYCIVALKSLSALHCTPERRSPAPPTRTPTQASRPSKPRHAKHPAPPTGRNFHNKKEPQTTRIQKGHLKHSNLNKMKRQRNTQQVREHEKCPPSQTKEEDIGNLPEKEFRIMIMKMIQKSWKQNRVTDK